MGAVKLGAELVAQLMGSKVLGRTQAGEIVMGDASGPHQFAHSLVVVWSGDRFLSPAHRVAQHTLGDLISEGIVGDGSKVAVQGVHHHIHHAAGNLIGRQGVGELRVHHRKARPEELAAQSPLLQGVIPGENSGVAGFAAGRRDGKHSAYRQGTLHRLLAQPEIPQVGLRVGHTQSNGLGGIDDAAASHRQNEICIHCLRLFHALPDLEQPRVWVDAAKGVLLQSRLGQRCLHLGNQPAAHRALSAIYHQHPVAALPGNQLAGLCLSAGTKYNLRRKRKGKCVHGNSSCPFSFLYKLYHIRSFRARHPGHFSLWSIGWTVA